MRFQTIAVVTFLSLSLPAYAGFEWVPPMKNPAVIPDAMPVDIQPPQAMMNDQGFPAPEVMMAPIDNKSNNLPISIMPETQAPVIQKPKNLSGKKLVIDPYPLQNASSHNASVQTSIEEIYKAMNEESGKLHPVNLGNGMSTGAKKISMPIPDAVKMASTSSHQTFLTPNASGLTPMIGAEPAPLPGAEHLLPQQKPKASSYPEAVGFGRDLPLALALSQVIPSDYVHSFAKDVDAGASVSWEGGQPWDEVLNTMLAPQSLTAVIQGNQVIIQPMARL